MLERFTARARQVIAAAREDAVATLASEVRPEHLLRALADDEDCVATKALVSLGADPATVREQVDRQRRRYVDGLDEDDAEALRVLGIDLDEVVRRIDSNLGGLGERRLGRTRFSRNAKKVLELALREALHLRHNYIGTEHVLLGLLRCDDRVVDDSLVALGLGKEAIRQAITEQLREAG